MGTQLVVASHNSSTLIVAQATTAEKKEFTESHLTCLT